VFFATVSLRGEVIGTGEGRSKKQAEQSAARAAWSTLHAHGGPSTDGAGSGVAGTGGDA
jgi:ribonuclease-3